MDRTIHKNVDLHLAADTVVLHRINVPFRRGVRLAELLEYSRAPTFWHGIEDGDDIQVNGQTVFHAGPLIGVTLLQIIKSDPACGIGVVDFFCQGRLELIVPLCLQRNQKTDEFTLFGRSQVSSLVLQLRQ